MNNNLYINLASGNIKRNSQTYMPYMFTCMLMTAMTYIIHSLSVNPALNEMRGGYALKEILSLGTIITCIFSFIFLIYTNSFLIKRRKKEFGLFNILGMEKRHISIVILIETLFTALITMTGGFISGILLDKLMFLILNKILEGNIVFGFSISIPSVIMTSCLFGIIHLLIFLNSLRQISLAKPIDLLKGGNVGEREPKTKGIMAVIGIICLAAGYYISITTENPVSALSLFFLAVLLVIAGTYLLFTSGSIAFLKMLRKNKKYYYQTRHFSTVSGMIYRMKQNAAGLSSICILSTMVLVMLSTTTSFMIGIEDILCTRYPFSMEAEIYTEDISRENAKEIIKSIKEESMPLAPENEYEYSSLSFTVVHESDDCYTGYEYNKAYNMDNGRLLFITLMDDFNRLCGENIALDDDEILICNFQEKNKPEKLTILGNNFNIKGYSDKYIQNGLIDVYAMKKLCIVVKDESVLMRLYDLQAELYKDYRSEIKYYYEYDTKMDMEAQKTVVDKINSEFNKEYLISRDLQRPGIRELYGGLFFLGMFLSVLFLVATIIIIYYKQITEGFEDKHRFTIMQNVGMSLDEVKSTIHSQILMVFFLPLITAGIHTAFAFPIIRRIIMMLNMNNVPLYIMCTIGSFLIFAVCYGIVYSLTAKIYYKIVANIK